jgi:hypothetical protein
VVAVAGTIGVQTATATTYPLTGLPEIGRCVKVAPGTGLYKYNQYKNCVVHSPTGKGSYEWFPGPGETNDKFEATLNKFLLETVGGKKVQCGGFVTGEYKDSKTATVELEMKGCNNLATHQKCQGPTPEEGEINAPLGGIEAEIGFIRGGAEKPIVGWDIKPKKEQPSPNVLEFTCGTPVVETVEDWSVEGSVIGALKSAEKMTSIFKLTYNATGGKQQFERFEGGLKDTLLAKIVTVPTTGPPSSVSEEAGLITRGETKPFVIENGEPLEIKAKFK